MGEAFEHGEDGADAVDETRGGQEAGSVKTGKEDNKLSSLKEGSRDHPPGSSALRLKV